MRVLTLSLERQARAIWIQLRTLRSPAEHDSSARFPPERQEVEVYRIRETPWEAQIGHSATAPLVYPGTPSSIRAAVGVE